MKIQKLMQVKGVFEPFAREKVSPAAAYKLFKFISALDNEASFYNGKVHELLEEFGTKNQDGVLIPDSNGNAIIPEEKQAEFERACTELNNIEVTPPDITFTISELNGITLSAIDIAIIEDFIKEE